MAEEADGRDDPESALRDVRARFIAAFPGRCDSIGALITGDDGTDLARIGGARQIAHRLTGIAGTIGFPTVSARAAELEAFLTPPDVDTARANDLLAGLREAYATDLMRPPDWAAPVSADGARRTVLVVEDDPDQLAIVESHLRRAGYQTVSVTRGDEAAGAARAHRPSLILLDVDLPGMDGYAVCRALKTNPDIAGIPVVFVTTYASIDSRLSGLTLGADDYLCKPIDARELLLRVSRLTAPVTPAAQPNPDTLPFEAFMAVGEAALAAGPVALGLLRMPPASRRQCASLLGDECRRHDVVGLYDDAHLVWLLPGLKDQRAVGKLRAALDRAADDGIVATAGVAVGARGSRIAALVSQADEALTAARYRQEPVALWAPRSAEPQAPATRTLLLADDDPEVIRVVDGYMRSAGFQTVVVFDGAKALEMIDERRPDVVVLDLMMPALSGFDVLKRLQGHPARPRVVVLSARGREDDVARAFELGADDYIVKPFSPQEVRARIARLLK